MASTSPLRILSWPARSKTADTYTDLVWLEDRAAAIAALSQMAVRLSGPEDR